MLFIVVDDRDIAVVECRMSGSGDIGEAHLRYSRANKAYIKDCNDL